MSDSAADSSAHGGLPPHTTAAPVSVAWLSISVAVLVVLLAYMPALESPFLVLKLAALDVTAAVALVAFTVLRTRAERPRWSPGVALGVWLVLGTSVASWLVASRTTGAPYAVDALARWGALFALACGAGAIDDEPELRFRVAEAITAAGGMAAIVGLLQHVGHMPIDIPVRSMPGSTFGNRNLAGEMVAMALPFGMALTLGVPRAAARDGRAAMAVLALLELCFVAITRARGAWFGAVCGGGVTLWLLLARVPVRTRAKTGAWVASALLISGIAAALPGRFMERDAGDTKRFSGLLVVVEGAVDPHATALKTRLGYWRRTLTMIGEHPLVGVGPGNWPILFPHYAEPYATRDDVLTTTIAPRQVHNDLLERTVETGVLGTLALLFLAFVTARAARVRLRVVSTDASDDRPVTAAAAGALVGVVAIGLVGFPLVMPTTIALAAISLGFVAMDPAPPLTASRASSPLRWLVVAGAVLVGLAASLREVREVRANRELGTAERALRSDYTVKGAERALAALAQAPSGTTSEFTIQLRTSQMQTREKHGALAVAAAERALALEPYSINARGALAAAYLAGGDVGRARDTATAALAILPEFPFGLFVRIRAEKQTEPEAASADYQALLKLSYGADDRDTRDAARALLSDLDHP